MTNALTRFGQRCRDLRTSRNRTMGDQADAFICSTYFISSIETGRQQPSDEYIQNFRVWLHLTDREHNDLVGRLRSNVVKFPKFTTTNSASMRLFRKISKMNPGEIRKFRKISYEAKDDGRL
jgi:transcriptional regulator with XRE-family HTH domain